MTEKEAMIVQKQKDIRKIENFFAQYPLVRKEFVNKLIKAMED